MHKTMYTSVSYKEVVVQSVTDKKQYMKTLEASDMIQFACSQIYIRRNLENRLKNTEIRGREAS